MYIYNETDKDYGYKISSGSYATNERKELV